jgi:hypothetical protein
MIASRSAIAAEKEGGFPLSAMPNFTSTKYSIMSGNLEPDKNPIASSTSSATLQN